MKKKETPPTYLTPKQAVEVLGLHLEGKKKRVHTMENVMFGMMGCDMDLTDIKKAFEVAEADDICLSGPNMRGQNHGVAVWRENKGWLFISTDEEKLKKFEKSLVVKK